MADENTPGVKPEGTPTTTPTTADANGQQANGQTSQDSDVWRNPKEIVSYFKRQQKTEDQLKELTDLVKKLTDGSTPSPATLPKPEAKPDKSADDRLAAVERELAETKKLASLSTAYADFGVNKPEARQLIELATGSMTPEQARSFVEQYAKANPAPSTNGQQQTPVVPPPAAPAGRSNAGAPTLGSNTNLPEDPRLIPPDAWKAMSSKERRERHERWLSSQGVTANPWRQRKDSLGAK